MFTILILPLIPVIWAIGGMLALFGGYKAFQAISKSLSDGDKLLFLGMPVSGKTYMLSKLRNAEFNELSTYIDEFKNFNFKVGDKTILISSVKEIGGEVTLRSAYDSAINGAKVVIYMFDIAKYLSTENNLMYRRDCNSRFSSINKLKKENAFYIGTHLDMVNKSESDIKKEFAQILKGKDYENIIQRMCFTNLKDNKEFEKLKKIFLVINI